MFRPVATAGRAEQDDRGAPMIKIHIYDRVYVLLCMALPAAGRAR
jgi:hypothetical protein